MNKTIQVIPPAPLFFHHLRVDLVGAFRSAAQQCETQLSVLPTSKEELIWRDTQMVKRNGKLVLIKDPSNVTINLDDLN